MKELEKGSFEWALALMKQVKLVKRLCMKNDTIVIEYKGRLYQCSKAAMVRYPYVPTNADIFATDWIEVEPNSAYPERYVKAEDLREGDDIVNIGEVLKIEVQSEELKTLKIEIGIKVSIDKVSRLTNIYANECLLLIK